jgi:hypothetical protein
MKVFKDLSYHFSFLLLLLTMLPVSSAFSFGPSGSEEIRLVELRKVSPFPDLSIPKELVRPGFIGLISEEEERQISIRLNPLIDPLDPYTMRLSSLDLVHSFYLGR